MSLFVPGDAELRWIVRVETVEDRGMDSAVYITLTPGHNEVRVPLDSLIPTAQGRAGVRNWLMFTGALEQDRRIYVAGAQLEP